MGVHHLRSGASGCWARLDGIRCQRVQGHGGWHVCDEVHWPDHSDTGFYGSEGIIDVDLDGYNPEGAA
jgi:hypothetical protein